MTFKKLEETDIFTRSVKYSWVAPLLKGEVKDKDMQSFMLELIFKTICDKDGNDLQEDDLSLDDFMAAQKFIMNKVAPEKKS
jgi:hypothetical protein